MLSDFYGNDCFSVLLLRFSFIERKLKKSINLISHMRTCCCAENAHVLL